MSALVLSQHYLESDRIYRDVEGVLYHYPRQYWARMAVRGKAFVYYRPLGNSRQRADSRHYFGHGFLGTYVADPDDSNQRFSDIVGYEPFPRIVPLRQPSGRYYETESDTPVQGQSAVREISDLAYQRILAAADVDGASLVRPVATQPVLYSPAPVGWPTDAFRVVERFASGAGYRPNPDTLPNVYETAALQERARADHQEVLNLIAQSVNARGGRCEFNNNVDLFATLGNERFLVEAKSLAGSFVAVDRMRYGMGQLFDYSVRYRAELQGAKPVLAFGRPPDRETSWIGTVLQENGVGFVCKDGDRMVPFNEHARQTVLFS